jgi:tetratricopeptide (TPR) repeat protein
VVDHDRYCIGRANAELARALSGAMQPKRRAEILREAVLHYSEAIALGAYTEAAYGGMGQALLEGGGAVDDAVEVLTRAVELSPTNAHTQSTLSAAYQKRGQLADAVRAAMDAVDADPSVPALYNNLGVLLASLEQHEAALEHGFLPGLRVDARDAEMLCNTAVSTAELGRYASAAEMLTAVLGIDPMHTRARANLDALNGFLKAPTPAAEEPAATKGGGFDGAGRGGSKKAKRKAKGRNKKR